jgi:kynurenine 3-monooxygenase
MRDKVDDVPFMRKRKIEMQLEQQFPDYYSKYSLVTFQPNLPYAKAKEKGRKQDELLLKLCAKDDFERIPLELFYNKLMNL